MAPLLIILNAMEIASRKKEMNIEKDRYTLWVDQNLKYIAVPHLVSVKVCIWLCTNFPNMFHFYNVCGTQACAPFRLDHTILNNFNLHVKGTRMNCISKYIIYLHVHWAHEEEFHLYREPVKYIHIICI